MQVKTFKLITGEEVIAEMYHHDDDYVEILRPVALVETETGSVSLVPWLFSVDLETPIKLDAERIFLIADAHSAFVQAYHQYDRSLKMYQENLENNELEEIDDYDEDCKLVTVH